MSTTLAKRATGAGEIPEIFGRGRPESPLVADAEPLMNLIAASDDAIRALLFASQFECNRVAQRLDRVRRDLVRSIARYDRGAFARSRGTIAISLALADYYLAISSLATDIAKRMRCN